MSNEIQSTRNTNQLPVQEVAKYFSQSGMFPDVKQLATAATKLIVGRGLGLTDYDCMAGFHMIQGKAVLASNAMSAAIKASGKYEYRVVENTDEACRVDFYSVHNHKLGDKIGSTEWTMDKAKRAGLNGANWKKYPAAMLFARTISEGYRTHCPDALGCAAPVYIEQHGESEIPREYIASEMVDTTARVVEDKVDEVVEDKDRKSSNREVDRACLQGRSIHLVEPCEKGSYKWFEIAVEGDDRKFTTFSETMKKVAESAKIESVLCDLLVVQIEKANGQRFWNLKEIEIKEGGEDCLLSTS
tara:strand:- start:12692 stop:13594 length:903 start_codon:yes stop_codon:yes gene_type:complete